MVQKTSTKTQIFEGLKPCSGHRESPSSSLKDETSIRVWSSSRNVPYFFGDPQQFPFNLLDLNHTGSFKNNRMPSGTVWNLPLNPKKFDATPSMMQRQAKCGHHFKCPHGSGSRDPGPLLRSSFGGLRIFRTRLSSPFSSFSQTFSL